MPPENKDPATELEALRKRLEDSPVERAKFTANLLELFQKSGVNLSDAKSLEELALELDPKDLKKWKDGLTARTVVITVAF